ncbi:MAG: MlaD family protein [Rickettsiales bacterium]|jgi:phospholipid/cholesterol/gamma-HCH transport system substrate-binding protein|nr:MlaD family protein [Rickettsiales bacterium]
MSRAAAYAFSFVILVLLAVLAFPARRSGSYTLVATVRDIGDLKKGAAVRLSGIGIGTVAALELKSDYSVRVVMSIDGSIRIPEDSALAILSDGLMGAKYASVIPGSSADFMTDGGSFEYAQNAIDINKMIGIGVDKFAGNGKRE